MGNYLVLYPQLCTIKLLQTHNNDILSILNRRTCSPLKLSFSEPTHWSYSEPKKARQFKPMNAFINEFCVPLWMNAYIIITGIGMYVCLYIYVHMYLYIHTHSHTHIYICSYFIYMFICSLSHTHTHIGFC